MPSTAGSEMQFEIRSARITLDDRADPSLVVGPALDGANMTVADVGAGISTVRLELDGRLVGQTTAACAPPFVEPVPCPARRDVSLPFDVASLPDGDHSLLATAVAERAQAWFRGKSRAVVRTLKYGECAVVEGSLADSAGQPVVNAPVAVSERGDRRDELAAAGFAAHGREGAVLVSAAGGTESCARVLERSGDGSGDRASAGGRDRPHVDERVRNGSVLKFTGRVLGRQRALVTIYALSAGPRKRIPVETVRAGSSGRFSYTYRFARIPGPSVYRFVALVPKQTGFPHL